MSRKRIRGLVGGLYATALQKVANTRITTTCGVKHVVADSRLVT